jgi:hypothetical protein
VALSVAVFEKSSWTVTSQASNDELLLKHEILGDHRAHATGATPGTAPSRGLGQRGQAAVPLALVSLTTFS